MTFAIAEFDINLEGWAKNANGKHKMNVSSFQLSEHNTRSIKTSTAKSEIYKLDTLGFSLVDSLFPFQ